MPSTAVRSRTRTRLAICAVTVLAFMSGCTVYQPVAAYPSGPSVFDRSWNAALAAADDVGVSVYSADRARGVILGTQGAAAVTTNVFTQADGSVRVEFNVKDPAGNDAALAQRLSQAYNRRMGR